MYKHSMFTKLLKEPLIHFLLIGVGLFFLFYQLNSDEETGSTQSIIINKSKIEALSSTFLESNGRESTPKEMRGLVEEDIREEVLYREAISIGLDKDDMIIRRRLIEKMKYLFEDLMFIDEPNDEELKIYFQNNTDTFMDPSGSIPEYSKMKDRVKLEWIGKQQEQENEAFYAGLKKRYEIIMDDKIGKDFNISAGLE